MPRAGVLSTTPEIRLSPTSMLAAVATRTMWLSATGGRRKYVSCSYTTMCLPATDYVSCSYGRPQKYVSCSYGTMCLAATPDFLHPIDPHAFSTIFGSLGRALGFNSSRDSGRALPRGIFQIGEEKPEPERRGLRPCRPWDMGGYHRDPGG